MSIWMRRNGKYIIRFPDNSKKDQWLSEFIKHTIGINFLELSWNSTIQVWITWYRLIYKLLQIRVDSCYTEWLITVILPRFLLLIRQPKRSIRGNVCEGSRNSYCYHLPHLSLLPEAQFFPDNRHKGVSGSYCRENKLHLQRGGKELTAAWNKGESEVSQMG